MLSMFIKNDKSIEYDKKETDNNKKNKKNIMKRFWADKRSYKTRFILALFSSLLMYFTVIIAGPFDIVTSNKSSFVFTIGDIILPLLMLFSVAVIITTVLLAFLRGFFFNFMSSLLFAIAVMLFIQGMFLNKDLGALDGAEINWKQYQSFSYTNLFVWGAVIMLVSCFLVDYKKIWEKVLKFVPIIMIAMQLSIMASALPRILNTIKIDRGLILSTENEFMLSSKENTVVFIIDWFSQDTMYDMIEKYPDVLDGFKDFTRYDNYSSEIAWTFYATPFLMNGTTYDTNKKYEEYLATNFTTPKAQSLYSALRKANYKTQVFTDIGVCTTNFEQVKDKIDNIRQIEEITLDKTKAIKNILKVSLFRYAPHEFKKEFWTNDEDFANIIKIEEKLGYTNYYFNDTEFYQRLKTNRIYLQDDNNSFTFYHMHGAHAPFWMNSMGERSGENNILREDQSRGVMRIIEEYMNQMKEFGIYENSNIIIVADHGSNDWGDRFNAACVFMLKQSGISYDKVQISNAPVAQVDMLATYAVMMNLDVSYKDLGRPVFDYKENEERTRIIRHWIKSDKFPETNGRLNALTSYSFTGHAYDFNLTYAEPYEILPLIDSYN